MREANQKLPTFLYVMPFSSTKLFLEETSLVSQPAFDFKELKERLHVRYLPSLALYTWVLLFLNDALCLQTHMYRDVKECNT